MKKWMLAAVIGVLFSLAGSALLWWLWSPASGSAQTVSTTKSGPSGSVSVPAAAPGTKAIVAPQVVQKNAARAPAADIAGQYQQVISYPPYATPITAQNDYLLSPNRFETVTVEGDHGRSWSLSLSQYRYAYPEPILASVRFQGDGPAPQTVRYQVQRLDDLAVLQQGELSVLVDAGHSDATGSDATGRDATAGGAAPTSGRGQYQLTLAGRQEWPAELRLVIEPQAGSSEGVGASFLYVQPVARVVGVGALHAVDTDLQIPLTIEVEQAGLYRVQAVLQQVGSSASDLVPLALLQQEVLLGTGRQPLQLKAHHSVLPDTPLELALSHIQLQRASLHPAEPTRFGVDQLKPLPLGAFSKAALTKTPYQPDQAEQARLQLLSELQQ